MPDRKEYFKQYWIKNKPTPEERKLLTEANRDKNRERNKKYREKCRKERLGRPKLVKDLTPRQIKQQGYYQAMKARKQIDGLSA